LSSAKTLQVSYIGMKTEEVAIKNDLVITLKPDAHLIDEVMVVAYGTAKKSSFTGSAATVNSEELKKRQVSNVTKALDGLAPGVQATTGSGQPGSSANVQIRGYGSINASTSPLYVVDGVPYDGNIAAINPEDIENATVLKDASAGALYGARGANGVIMITTRKGKSGRTDVSLKATVGFSNRALPRYKTMKSGDYIEALYSAYYNQQIANGVPASQAGNAALQELGYGSTKVFGENEQYNPFNYSITELIDPATGKIRSDAILLWEDNWMDEVNKKNALRTEYQLSVDGGSETAQYMFSLGYVNEEGILKTTKFERYSGRTNIETQPKEWFSAGFGANFAHHISNTSATDSGASSNVWYSAALMGPIFPVYERDRGNGGAYILDSDGNRIFDYGINRPTGQQQNFNSVATLYDDKYSTVYNSLSARTHVDFGGMQSGWFKELKMVLNFGVDYYGAEQMTYYNPYFGNAASSNGRIQKVNNQMMSYTFNQILTYEKSFAGHTIDALLAHEYYSYQISKINAHKTGFPFDGLYEPDAASTVYTTGGSKDTYRIESYFGRLNYNYADKYYLSGSYRRDGSSRFYKDNRWGDFWSIGANYRISEEEFMESYDWLDNLSVRASYGVQGNDALLDTEGNADYYPWQSSYDLAYSNGSESGALVTSVENKNVTWESNHNLNIGMDISLWRRLQVELEWYSRKTKDLLLYYPLAMSSGFEGYFRNAGSMRNSGFEATLSGSIIRTRDLDWSLTLMGATIKNKVLKLTEDGQDILDGSQIIREGEAIYSYYVARSAGVDPLTGEQLYWATVDANGNDTEAYITTNSTYAQASRYVAGSKFPKLYGSIGTQLTYKGFDFSVSANYSIGGKMVDNVYQNLMSFYYAGQAKHVNLKKAWKQPGDVTDIPKYEIGVNHITTDDMLISASYLSIKNITLGYTLPSKVIRNMGLRDLRFSMSADNLYMFTHLKGMNPQYSFTGGTTYVYAPSRTISFGVDVKF